MGDREIMKTFAFVGNWGVMLPPGGGPSGKGPGAKGEQSPLANNLGIDVFSYENGDLSRIQNISASISAGAMALSEDGSELFVLDEKKDDGLHRGGGGGGSVFWYAFDEQKGTLSEISHTQSLGVFPSYICISQDGRYALVTNHGGGRNPITKTRYSQEKGYETVTEFDEGNVVLFEIDREKRIMKAVDVDRHEGCSIGRSQFSPHPHSVHQLPGKNMFVVTDKGNDCFYMYEIRAGKLHLLEGSPLKGPEGYAPRYVAVNPDKPYIYCINENVPAVTVIEYDDHGHMSIKETVEALFNVDRLHLTDDKGRPVKPDPADIVITENGRYVYASIRNKNSLSTFQVSEDGSSLSLVNVQDCGGSNPRGLGISPDGKYLFVANLDSGTIRRFIIDAESGNLIDSGMNTNAVHPANIKLLTIGGDDK